MLDKIIPCILVNFVFIITNKTVLVINKIAMLMLVGRSIITGDIITPIPKSNVRFAINDPTMVPTARFILFFLAADKDTISSGKDVLNAMMLAPKKDS